LRNFPIRENIIKIGERASIAPLAQLMAGRAPTSKVRKTRAPNFGELSARLRRGAGKANATIGLYFATNIFAFEGYFILRALNH
jgi:hypothetical protein